MLWPSSQFLRYYNGTVKRCLHAGSMERGHEGPRSTPFCPRRAAKGHEEHLFCPRRAAKDHEGPPRTTKNTFYVVTERGDQGRIGSFLHADVLDFSRSESNSPSDYDHKSLYVLSRLKQLKKGQASRPKRSGGTGVFRSDGICAFFFARRGKAGEDGLSCRGEKGFGSGCGENRGTHFVDTLH